MTLVVSIYIVAVLLLAAGLGLARLNSTLRGIGKSAATAVAAMRNASMDDLEKEKTVQRCAVAMVRQAVALAVKLAVILLVAALPVWLSAALGWMDMQTFWAFVLRLDVLLISTAVVLLPLLACRYFGKRGR